MNKWYFGVPLLALVLFGAYFAKFKAGHDAAIMADEQKAKEDAQEKALRDAYLQRLAIEENNRITEENNKKKAEEKERERLEKEARELAIQTRDERNDELNSLRREYEQVQKDLYAEEQLLESAKTNVASLEAERTFLAGYVQLAEKNGARMSALVEKVDKAAEAVRKQLDEIAAAKKR
jgi:hypothetical protein